MDKIKKFYDSNNFPGLYTSESLDYHMDGIRNPYLKVIDRAIRSSNAKTVLDLGCGTGFITNFFAKKYPDIQFTGVDFASSIDHARKIAKINNSSNVKFVKKDILNFDNQKKFDLVICQGVLHHIPDHTNAVKRILSLVKNDLIIGLYHPMGKVFKKIFKINYGDKVLHDDQENHPYETAFTKNGVKNMFSKFEISSSYPGWLIRLRSLFNYRNGGLVTYYMTRRK